MLFLRQPFKGSFGRKFSLPIACGTRFKNTNKSITSMKTPRAKVTNGLDKYCVLKLNGSMGTSLICAGCCPFYLPFIFIFIYVFALLYVICVQVPIEA